MSDTTDLVELLRKIGIRASRDAIEAWLTHAAKTKASPAQIAEQLCTSSNASARRETSRGA